MMKKTIILIFIILNIVYSNAQENQIRPERKVRYIPVKLLKPKSTITSYGQFKKLKKNIPGRAWRVYSDRENNLSYTHYDVSKARVKNRNIRFLEEFYVYETYRDMIHLVKNIDLNTNKTTKETVDCGWIHISNLLLSNHCLKTKKNISRKMLLINVPQNFKKGDLYNSKEARFYLSPDLSIRNNKILSLFKILYVFKEMNNAFLVGYYEIIKGRYSTKPIGWVSRSKAIEWNTRIVIEPNWDDNAVKERLKRNVRVNYYDSKKKFNRYLEKEKIKSEGFYKNRKKGMKPRDPVIELINTNNSFRVAALGNVINIKGKSISEDALMDGLQEVQIKIRETDKLNLVFVIDGTKSMSKYFKTVATAIDETMSNYSSNKKQIKFGCVIYRDFAHGKHIIERKKLTSFTKISNFLRTSKVIVNDADDLPEAMNFGLYNALKLFYQNKDQTNFIILLGDAGNHNRNDISQISTRKLIEKFKIMNCNLISYQVNYDRYNTYNDFNTQINNINTQLTKSSKAYLYKHYSRNEKETDLNMLKKSIVKFISESIKISNGISDGTESLISKGKLDEINEKYKNDMVTDFTPIVREKINRLSCSQEIKNFILNQKFQTFNFGWAQLKHRRLKNDLYKFVIFVNRNELNDIKNDIEKLAYNDGNTNSRREGLYNAWIGLLKKRVGDEFENLRNGTLNEINQHLFQVTTQSKFLSGYKLDDIINPRIVDDETIGTIIASLERKVNQIDEILSDREYPYLFMNGKEDYYWISTDILP